MWTLWCWACSASRPLPAALHGCGIPPRDATGKVEVEDNLVSVAPNERDITFLREIAALEVKGAYDQLCAYTLTRGDAAFIHQHVVDAFAAQHAGEHSKPIGITFALVGLYLLVERGWTGKQVQRAHMQLARQKHAWPAFVLPADRGSMTAIDVMREVEGSARDRAIHAWCRSVWTAFTGSRESIAGLLRQHGIGGVE